MPILSKPISLFAFVFLLPCSLFARFELAGWFSLGKPIGRLKDYSYGVTSIGGTARLSWGFENKNLLRPTYFTEVNYADLGLETGYIPADPNISEQALNVATDYYLLMFNSGISFGKNTGDYQPYFDLFGGPTYYSTLSSIASRYQTNNLLNIKPESSGVTWHAGIGAGIKVLLWHNLYSTRESLFNAILCNINVNIRKGGKTEYLDWRSVRFLQEKVSYNSLRVNSDIFQVNFGGSVVF